jgi:hypothetical protein
LVCEGGGANLGAVTVRKISEDLLGILENTRGSVSLTENVGLVTSEEHFLSDRRSDDHHANLESPGLDFRGLKPREGYLDELGVAKPLIVSTPGGKGPHGGRNANEVKDLIDVLRTPTRDHTRNDQEVFDLFWGSRESRTHHVWGSVLSVRTGRGADPMHPIPIE